MRREVIEALRHRSPEQRITMEFRHDVFKYLFRGKGKKSKEKNWILFDEKDLCRCNLPKNWDCSYNQHGDGVKLKFPLKMRTSLGLSPKCYQRVKDKMVEVARAYKEKISLRFLKMSSSCGI